MHGIAIERARWTGRDQALGKRTFSWRFTALNVLKAYRTTILNFENKKMQEASIVKRIPLIMLVVGLSAVNGHAASWIVWPGQSLQAAITDASAGDNIILKEGIYVENITLTKGLDIRSEVGKESTTAVHGTWTIQNTTGPVYLKGFKIGVSATGNITVTNCTDVRLDYVIASPSALSVVNSKFYLYRSSFSGNATFNGGDWTVQRSTISGSLTNSNADTKLLASTVNGNVTHSTYAKDCTVFQSNIGGKLYVSATNYWVGYNFLWTAEFRDGPGVCSVVGNWFNVNNQNADGITLWGTSPIIRNNVVFNNNDGYSFATAIRIYGNCNPLIVNNVIDDWTGGQFTYSRNNGIYADSGSKARIINNIINVKANCFAVSGPATVEVRYCNFGNTSSGVNGPTEVSNLATPITFGSSFTLPAGAVCINAGDPSVEFNDLDNTRGDIGWYGGHSYDPSGRTTTNPVVMDTQASPLYIKRGQTITLKARGAVSAD